MRPCAQISCIRKLRWLCSFAILLSAPLPSYSASVQVAVESMSPPILLKQNARISVTLKDKPVEGVVVLVFRQSPSGEEAKLSLDQNGTGRLPTLPPGQHSIQFMQANQLTGIRLDVCVIPCGDQWPEITDFVPTVLHGPLVPLDENARALDDIRVRLTPVPGFVWGYGPTTRTSVPILGQFREFRGVIQDRTGSDISKAQIEVLRVGAEDKTNKGYFADETGRFHIQLPDGEYVVIIRSPGFRSRTLHFVISHSGVAEDLHVVLEIAEST